MAAETQYTANTGLVQFAHANTSLTGGTIGTDIFTVITGAANGTLIKNVTMKCTGTPSQGMIRFFVYDGTNQRLLMEVDVDPIEQAGTDISYEKTVPLNFKLSKGYSLLVSAQVADTFNVIAEGLDISYFTNFVRPESTNYTANTGFVNISTGTSSMTGSGTSRLISATNGTNGLAIDSITIKATAATTADGMIRFFISPDNGSTFYLFTEVFVPYTAQSGTYQSFEHVIEFPDKLQLKGNSNYGIWVSTQNSNTFSIVAEGMDWSYPGGALSNFTPASATGTGSSVETVLHYYQIPKGFIFSGGLLQVYANIATNNTGTNKVFKIYANNTNTLSGSQVTLATYTTANLTGDNISRLFPVISDTVLECYGGTATSTQNEYATTTGTSANSSTIPSVSGGTLYILITTTLVTLGDIGSLRWSMIRRIY